MTRISLLSNLNWKNISKRLPLLVHLSLIVLIGICLLSGCGGGSSTPPPPAAPLIGVNLSTNAAAIDQNQSVPLTATVTNDSSSKGVNWTVTCPSGVSSCGSMAQPSSGSGVANTFTAPANVAANEAVMVTATSTADSTTKASATVTVSPPPALLPPSKQPPVPVGTVGQKFSLDLMMFVTGGAQPFNWTINSGTLPAGLSLNASTGVVSGTPTRPTIAPHSQSQSAPRPLSVGTLTITFVCTDSGTPPLTVTLTIIFTVNRPPLVITSPALPATATLGTLFGPFTLTATGALAPYIWAVSAGALPTGVTLKSNADNTATVSGTPTTLGGPSIGTITVTASDPGQANLQFSITVVKPGALAITSGNPPNGQLTAQYNNIVSGFTLTAAGGKTGYKWALASGSGPLPTGLNLTSNADNTGSISGTPTVLGSFTFTVQVTDSETPAVTVTATYTVNIPATCTPGPGTLCGLYIFLVQGFDSSGPLAAAGIFTADGISKVTGGTLDRNTVTNGPQTNVMITGGSFTVGTDQRGTLTLITASAGTFMFTFAGKTIGTTPAFLIEFDDTTSTGTGSHASGFLRQSTGQFTPALIGGTQAFGFIGGSTSGRVGMIGALTATGTSGLCGLNSNGNTTAVNNAGTPTRNLGFTCAAGTGLPTLSKTTGRGTVTFTFSPSPGFSNTSLNFAFYVMDATRLVFISIDTIAAKLPLLSGRSIFQFNANINCGASAGDVGCVFGDSAQSSGGTGAHVTAGRAVQQSDGTLTITLDSDKAGVITTNQTTPGATFSITSAGTGAITPPAASGNPATDFVLTGPDNGFILTENGGVSFGFLRPQTATTLSSSPGTFSLGTQFVGTGSVPNVSGILTPSAPTGGSGTLAGTLDVEEIFTPPVILIPGALITGNYTIDSTTGRATGSSTAPGPSVLVFYNVGANEIVLIESDTLNRFPVLIDLIQ